MKITKGEIWEYLQSQTIADIAKKLHKKLGDKYGTEESLKGKIHRIKSSVPKKSVESVEFRYWAKTVVFEAVPTGRPKARLSDTPTYKTVSHIIQPKVDELINFAEEQGISLEELIDILSQRNAKKPRKLLTFR